MVIRYVFYRFLLYFYYIFGYLTMMLCHCPEGKIFSIISFFINQKLCVLGAYHNTGFVDNDGEQ